MTSLTQLGRELKNARDDLENEIVKVVQRRSDGTWLAELKAKHLAASTAFHQGWAKRNA